MPARLVVLAEAAAEPRPLRTVFPQRGLNRRLHRLINRPCAAQFALPLLRHPRRQVAGAGTTVFRLAFGGQAESLLSPFVGFLLGHIAIPVALDVASSAGFSRM